MDNGLSILNVSEGDTKLSFDPNKPIERERAARIVTDMLKRGYAILIHTGGPHGKPVRATGFDPNTCEYLIEGLSAHEEDEIARIMSGDSKGKKKRGRPARVPAATASAIAVARTARGCSPGSWA